MTLVEPDSEIIYSRCPLGRIMHVFAHFSSILTHDGIGFYLINQGGLESTPFNWGKLMNIGYKTGTQNVQKSSDAIPKSHTGAKRFHTVTNRVQKGPKEYTKG